MHTSSCRSDVPEIPKELVSLCWWQKSGPSQDPVRREKREEEGRGEEQKETKREKVRGETRI